MHSFSYIFISSKIIQIPSLFNRQVLLGQELHYPESKLLPKPLLSKHNYPLLISIQVFKVI